MKNFTQIAFFIVNIIYIEIVFQKWKHWVQEDEYMPKLLSTDDETICLGVTTREDVPTNF